MKKIVFSLVYLPDFTQQRHDSMCHKLIWACLTSVHTVGGQTIQKCLSRWGPGCIGAELSIIEVY